ncbi:FadD32-like long-chain-fatty-acid--AMP ligase [Corynebacterium tapiri]|uniref:AMP-binding protein n=1 Tax=Corynebacterium tapiri TaxID=1448266 RepID=A0A5C4U1D4_9CORY|nr:FadD32-like long-chain-fatty-acid--AMP ligase [Corynebacterium tapiri]TNL95581.1 AMP-binding protein [Corynebacterium tapiri]
MDLNSALRQFFTETGDIQLPPQLTLAGLSELMYQADVAAGGGERPCMTFWDYSADSAGEARTFNRTQVNTRIKAVAARLQQVGSRGGRVAILAGNSPEYIFSFLGALYAGMVPVPLYDPNEPGHGEHLKAVLGDSQAQIVLTNRSSAAAVRRHFAEKPATERPRIVSVDALPDTLAASYVNPATDPQVQQELAQSSTMPVDTTAFLQYTSGSTRTPAGVRLTNRSIVTNVLQIFVANQLKTPLRLVTWLPLHHDMGIILASFVTILGLPMEMMTPRDFIQHPSRWTNQLAARKGGDVDTYGVVPNFALELAVRYGAPTEDQDFSNVAGIIIGSEPVSESAVKNFSEVFGAAGLDTSVLRPSYGLAEASLMVTTPQTPNRPLIKHFDRAELEAGRATEVAAGADNAVPYIANGQVVRPQALTIVDPETKAEVVDGVVGEIWAHGQNIAAGYLDRPEDTAKTFNQTLGERLADGTRAAGAPDEGWLATGDLGSIIDGELYITGRLKDLIVIAGRNHYPQDIEATVQEASEHVRADSVAAFAVPGEDVEKLVILLERADSADPSGDQEAIEDIRAAVNRVHGVNTHDIRVQAPMSIARSSSGKIARRVNQKAYLSES